MAGVINWGSSTSNNCLAKLKKEATSSEYALMVCAESLLSYFI
jgi:hypothetical protein